MAVRDKQFAKSAAIVVAVGLVARLFVLCLTLSRADGAKWLYSRGLEVGFVADSLLKGLGFASPFGGVTGPTALIAPGYPILVAGMFRLFGTYSTSAAVLIMLAHVVMNLATVLLVMVLARRLAGRRAAAFAGIFWACWPPLLWIPTIFWETSISACALIGMVLLAMQIVKQPSTKKLACFGVLWGALCLINMAFLLTFSAMFLWLAFRLFGTQAKGLVLAAVLALVVFSPWPVRNYRAFHAFVPLRTTVGLELWMGNHDGASGYVEEAMFPIYNKAELNEYMRVGELAYDHEKSVTSHKWIAAHPAEFAELSALRFVRFWSGTGSRGGSLIFALGAIATTVCGVWGLVVLYRKGHRAETILCTLPMLFFPLPYYITHAEFRYRLVLDPLLTVLAACALFGDVRSIEEPAGLVCPEASLCRTFSTWSIGLL